MDALTDYRKCPPNAFGAIVELAGAAFACVDDLETGYTENIERLMEALRVVRPDFADLLFFDGLLHMRREEWSTAESIFRNLVERSMCLPASRGMLLKCLNERQADGWEKEARIIIDECGNDDTARLAKGFIAREELKDAAETAKRTGQRFVAPKCVSELQRGADADDADAEVVASPTARDMLLTMQYMRV
jgi:type III secretion protein HrpB1